MADTQTDNIRPISTIISLRSGDVSKDQAIRDAWIELGDIVGTLRPPRYPTHILLEVPSLDPIHYLPLKEGIESKGYLSVTIIRCDPFRI